MKLTFLGASREVGRSAVLMETGKRMLFDYGVKLGEREHPDECGQQVHRAVLDPVIVEASVGSQHAASRRGHQSLGPFCGPWQPLEASVSVVRSGVTCRQSQSRIAVSS